MCLSIIPTSQSKNSSSAIVLAQLPIEFVVKFQTEGREFFCFYAKSIQEYLKDYLATKDTKSHY